MKEFNTSTFVIGLKSVANAFPPTGFWIQVQIHMFKFYNFYSALKIDVFCFLRVFLGPFVELLLLSMCQTINKFLQAMLHNVINGSCAKIIQVVPFAFFSVTAETDLSDLNHH
jgi:hypothetical protein